MHKIVLMNRCKRDGTFSIEEIFSSIAKINKNITMRYVPRYRIDLLSISKNLYYAYKKRGSITHITGDIHYVALVTGKRTILTIHDVGSLLNNCSGMKLWLKKLLWITLPTMYSMKITVISNFSKMELLKISPNIKDKILVIPNPVNPLLLYRPKKINYEKPKILHIGTKANKNLENTIKSLSGINCELIIVGKLSKNQLDLLKIYNINYQNYINLPFEKIAELYYECDIVSFISFYEGFGMPIIEAQRVGRVVITSTSASIPEVAGKGAHFVDPNNINEIRAGFDKLISSEEYRNQLINEGVVNSKKYTIEIISEQYQNLYLSLK